MLQHRSQTGAQVKIRCFLPLWAWWQWLVFLCRGVGGQGLPASPLVVWREWQRKGLRVGSVSEWNWGRVSRTLREVEVWRGACVELLWGWGVVLDSKQCSACSWYPTKDFSLGMGNTEVFPWITSSPAEECGAAELQLLTLKLSLAP